MIEVGDRIEMMRMPDDPDPIPPGTQGTVEYASEVTLCPPCTQVGVRWDNGRTLSVIIPPDQIRKVSA